MQRTDRPPQQRPRREETPGQGTIAAPGHPPMRAQPACPTDTGGAARDVLLAQLLEANERLVVACGAGALEILEAQAPNKRAVGARDFINGARVRLGEVWT